MESESGGVTSVVELKTMSAMIKGVEAPQFFNVNLNPFNDKSHARKWVPIFCLNFLRHFDSG
jgi:hypothetical protein